MTYIHLTLNGVSSVAQHNGQTSSQTQGTSLFIMFKKDELKLKQVHRIAMRLMKSLFYEKRLKRDCSFNLGK